MNTAKTLIRISILMALLTGAIAGIFAIPVDDSNTWYLDLLLSKAIAAGCVWLFSILYRQWRKTDPHIRAFHRNTEV